MCVSFPVRNLFDVLCRCLYVLGCSAANELREMQSVLQSVLQCVIQCVLQSVLQCVI